MSSIRAHVFDPVSGRSAGPPAPGLHLSGRRRSLALIFLYGLCGLTGLCGLSACTVKSRLAPACRPWEHEVDSTEPPTHCLFFPSGLAMDPLGDALYVANANADLSFGGGTMAVVDVVRYEHAVSCTRDPQAPNGCLDRTQIGAVCQAVRQQLDDSSTIESVAAFEREALSRGLIRKPSDLDPCFCATDLLEPAVVNCQTDRFVLRDQTVKTGNFSGQIALFAEDPLDWSAQGLPASCRGPFAPGDSRALEACRTLSRSLYLPVRGDPSVTHLRVRRGAGPAREEPLSSQATAAELTPRMNLRLDCGQERKPGELVTLCDDSFRVQRTADEVLIDPNDPEQGTRPRFIVPPEPFDLHLDRGCLLPGYTHRRGDDPPCQNRITGSSSSSVYYQYLVATHLAGADVSAYRLDGSAARPGIPILNDVRSGLYGADGQGRTGVFAVAPRVRQDPSEPWYLTSRSSGQISTFRLLSTNDATNPAAPATPTIVPGAFFDISNGFSTGQDVRELIFEPGGGRAFLTVQTPPTLAVLDTRPDPLSKPSGVPYNKITSIVDLCPGPARAVLSRAPRLSQGGGGAKIQNLLLVACYGVGRVAIVDPDRGELLDVVEAGRGPTSIVLNYGGELDGGPTEPCADPYVSTAAAKRDSGVTCPGELLRVRPDGDTPVSGDGKPRADANLPPRAYVTTYLDNTIAVIDLDPRSVTYRRVVSRIGNPAPKGGQ